jgi:tetratricopeptide (TPR) repeat protein
MVYEEWIDKSKDQYHRGYYTEALFSAEKAVGLNPNGVDGWWFSALSSQALGELHSALHALNVVTTIHPNFANGWARYGSLLELLNIDDNVKYKTSHHITAQEAFEQAIQYDSNQSSALTALAKIYSENDAEDETELEMRTLVQLEQLNGRLTTNQANRMGALHYKAKNFFDAINYYRQNIKNDLSSASMLHLGLVYSHYEVSQDADAIDIWRLALDHYPTYERPIEEIESLLPGLLLLAAEAQATGDTMLRHEQWYQHYINPLELINYLDDMTSVDDIDVKKVQRLRKLLVSEIELEDGLVEWMDHLTIDKSRAISIINELNNKKKAEYHLQIFNNKPLLNFLSKGEHKHFLVDQIWSPTKTIKYLEESENGFREWLTDIFVRQFSAVLVRTIQAENLPVLEVLLDGRRWLKSSKQDNCFKEARKKIDILLEPLKELKEDVELKAPSVTFIKDTLEQGSLLKMMNLFPNYFDEQRNKLVELILDVAVDAYNNHGNAELSIDILKIMDLFLFKSEKSNQLIQDAYIQVGNIIHQEKENEVLVSMESESGVFKIACSIRKDGIRRGSRFIATQDIQSIRFGVIGDGDKINSLYVFKSHYEEIIFQWNDYTGLSLDRAYLRRNAKLQTAIYQYIVPEIMKKSIVEMENKQCRIGPCVLTFSGVLFNIKKFLLFSEECFVPWDLLEASIEEGELILMDKSETEKRVKMSIRDTDNACLIIPLKHQISQL